MAKEIERVDTVQLPRDMHDGDLIVIICDDGTRYVFERRQTLDTEHHQVDTKILFSHRHYPNNAGADKYSNTRHRLPTNVEQYVRNKYGNFSWRDEMVPGAILNKETYATFNNEQDNQTA